MKKFKRALYLALAFLLALSISLPALGMTGMSYEYFEDAIQSDGDPLEYACKDGTEDAPIAWHIQLTEPLEPDPLEEQSMAADAFPPDPLEGAVPMLLAAQTEEALPFTAEITVTDELTGNPIPDATLELFAPVSAVTRIALAEPPPLRCPCSAAQ